MTFDIDKAISERFQKGDEMIPYSVVDQGSYAKDKRKMERNSAQSNPGQKQSFEDAKRRVEEAENTYTDGTTAARLKDFDAWESANPYAPGEEWVKRLNDATAGSEEIRYFPGRPGRTSVRNPLTTSVEDRQRLMGQDPANQQRRLDEIGRLINLHTTQGGDAAFKYFKERFNPNADYRTYLDFITAAFTHEMKSFDIDARMGQWDAANHSPHADQTERILKASGPKGDFIGRSDLINLENVINNLVDLAGGNRAAVEKILINLLENGGTDDVMNALDAIDNKNLAESLSPVSPTDPSSLEGYTGRMEDAQNPETPMNQIGANKPREEVVQTIYGEEPYYDSAYGNYLPRDVGQEVKVTESGPYDDGFEWAPSVGLTDRAKAILEEIQGAGGEGDFEGE